MRKLFLRHRPKHITLIFGRVRRLAKQIPSAGFVVGDPRIVTCYDPITPQFAGATKQRVEFQKAVAIDAWIWRSAVFVGVDETVDHTFAKTIRKIKNVIGNSQTHGNAARVLNVVERTTGMFFLNADFFVSVKFHGHADAIVSTLFHHERGNRRIHATAHGNQYFFHAPRLRSFQTDILINYLFIIH